jgi:hypothetical protein
VVKDLYDHAYWLPEDLVVNRPWLGAIAMIDETGDKKPLLNALRGANELTPLEREYLADLLERYELKKPRGRSRTPAYNRTDKVAILEMAADNVRELQKKGDNTNKKPMSFSAAVDWAAEFYDVSPGTLEEFCRGKYASSRRMKKRRPKN